MAISLSNESETILSGGKGLLGNSSIHSEIRNNEESLTGFYQ